MLKPVGLLDPKTGAKDPYAVVQLRQRQRRTVRCTTWSAARPTSNSGEQKRVFSMIPALRNAEFVRYGVMHRNTFLDSPRLLDATYRAEGRAAHPLCRAR